LGSKADEIIDYRLKMFAPYYLKEALTGAKIKANDGKERMLVSNAEYLQFVTDGGYSEKSYWTDEGWAWKSYKNATMPLFWIKDNGKYSLRLVAEIIPMPWSWPVEVNYLEAKAFCNWKTSKIGDKYRLPTEAEWYMLAQGAGAFNADGLSTAISSTDTAGFNPLVDIAF
jgi:hypothetical protein